MKDGDPGDNSPEAPSKMNPEQMELRLEHLHKRQRIAPGGGANSVSNYETIPSSLRNELKLGASQNYDAEHNKITEGTENYQILKNKIKKEPSEIPNESCSNDAIKSMQNV